MYYVKICAAEKCDQIFQNTEPPKLYPLASCSPSPPYFRPHKKRDPQDITEGFYISTLTWSSAPWNCMQICFDTRSQCIFLTRLNSQEISLSLAGIKVLCHHSQSLIFFYGFTVNNISLLFSQICGL